MKPKWVSDYFSFTKKERIAILTLVSLIAAVFILPALLPSQRRPPSAKEIEEFRAMAAILQAGKEERMDKEREYSYKPATTSPGKSTALFFFDPNTISVDEWRKLGVRDKTIHTIQKYLARGGHFSKREDLRKIYGLDPRNCEQLIPYVRINRGPGHSRGSPPDEQSVLYPQLSVEQERNQRSTMAKMSVIDLNQADTTDLIRLPGIGSKLAGRIINFRDRLGGFYSVDQVGETYGLRDSVFQIIKPFLMLGDQPIRQININTADVSVLKQHPYITWTVANAIVGYRSEHREFKSVAELRQIVAVSPELAKKLLPYLIIN